MPSTFVIYLIAKGETRLKFSGNNILELRTEWFYFNDCRLSYSLIIFELEIPESFL